MTARTHEVMPLHAEPAEPVEEGIRQRSRDDVATRPWGTGCLAWDLVDSDELRVTEEVMPPGTSEETHMHASARQVFLVLEGMLELREAGGSVMLGPGELAEVPPRLPHQAVNPTRAATRFLVISAPSTRGDRQRAELPAGRPG
jgi:mannose-6-phosphate isomerase-like protein (cupin superfamily)